MNRMWPGAVAPALLAVVGSQATSQFTPYQLDTATTLLAFLSLAQSWNILAGYGGLVSLGVSAFAGTGAYCAGLLEIHAGVGYVPAVAAAALGGAVLAGLLAVPLLRLRGDYFSIGTLAAALALQAWVVNWSYAGGSTGLNLPAAGVPGPVEVFQLACFVGAAAMITTHLVARSGYGMRLKAVRDDEPAAAALGVSVFRHRLGALTVSGALSGLTGALLALQQLSFEPGGMLGLNWTVNALLMTVVGGIGTVVGPAVGAVVVYYLLTKQLESYQTAGIIVEGVLLVLIVRFAPQGLWPLLTRGLARVRSRRAAPLRAPEPPARGQFEGG
ncbi:branched-chain amino acid ABC transporter permease [Actinacidiphila sp. DG2A-62]|uniref:branched-chain amino acid ABC transporter permease n=1 Tax=Actinacidiphila sp. DG2A-62 TaxID=3108821 RepID=UPI002DBB2A1F|nr:branched-chain amino acid ABC transporter permease [Actinacidiphila sp. DG2A-62]MEC3993758.1 branched-chain amino acid ABC transporter permease [Actinacidiphila sp. DG2A-62]